MGNEGWGRPEVTLMSGTSGVSRCTIACVKAVLTRRWYLRNTERERGRLVVGEGLRTRAVFLILCGRMGRGRVIVVSSGEEGMEIAEERRRARMLCGGAESKVTEGLRGMKEVMSGKGGRLGVDGVVGVSMGDCCWSCILGGAFVRL